MNTAANNWQRAKEIVADALELSLSERHTYVEAQLAQCPELRAEIESLLGIDTVDGQQSGFLQSPPTMPQDSPEEKSSLAGQMLGAWRLLEEIGRGGMGVVYLAERADGAYIQRAAVKLLRGAGRQDANRMNRERQALATLAHPNVARLIDGGTTTGGMPFLVMEYVEGETIERYCYEHHLNVAQRIALVIKLCEAVQSAHQQLLIHRDIKPSNILVDKNGEPKLLDFGIARLLESDKNLDGLADLTQAGALLFTPRYASPEQVNGTPVSVATDVYGIGALLYELLAGASPYPRMASTDTTNFAAVMRVVSEDTVGPASVLAKTGQPVFSALLKGDIDAILSKACAKLPHERYPTVAALEDDLVRWLEQKPISARAPSWVYRAKKFLSRHPIGTVLSLLSVCAIAAGLIGTIVQKNKAQARYEQVREIPTRVITKYYERIEDIAGTTAVRRDMVKDALVFLDDLAKDANFDARLAVDTAAGYRKMGEVMFNGRNMANLGDKVGGEAARAKAAQILLKVLTQDPGNTSANAEMAAVDADVGALLGSSGQVEQAMLRFDSAAKRYLLALKGPDKDGDIRFELIRTYLAAGAATLNEKKTAAPFLAQAQEQFLIWKSARPTGDKEIDNMQMFMYRIQYRQAVAFDGAQAALKYSDAEIAIIDQLMVSEPQNTNHLAHKLSALSNSAVDLLTMKHANEARQRLELAMAIAGKLAKIDPENVNHAGANAALYTTYGRVLLVLEQPEEAKRSFLQSIALWKFASSVDVLAHARRKQGEANFRLAQQYFVEKNWNSARQQAQIFLLLAEKHPDIFSKEPGSAWVTEAKLIKQHVE
jgi:serine/threonine protein kinase